MLCSECGRRAAKYGRDRHGRQRYQCLPCGRTFFAETVKPLGDLRTDMDEAVFALRLLAEGTSVRATERLTGLHRDTILAIVTTVGENCRRLLDDRIQCVEVTDVQCDELWGFVGCKEKRGSGSATAPKSAMRIASSPSSGTRRSSSRGTSASAAAKRRGRSR
jgi:transposase-like protein